MNLINNKNVFVRIFFFPNILNANFNTDEERAEHVGMELTFPVPESR